MHSGLFPYDLYFPELDLVVNIDGSSHYQGSFENKVLSVKHILRERTLRAVGVDFVSINQEEFGYLSQDSTKLKENAKLH